MLSDTKANILLIDDHVENLIALEAILDGLGQNLVKARSGEEALRCLLNQDFAVILLDVQMPGMDGFETASLIRQRARSQHTPIIFLTAFNSGDMWQMKGYALGAVDYLLKPIEANILISKVNVFVELFKKTQEIQRQAAELAAQKIEIIREQLARQQAEAASRMKDEFLAIVSHELRTPLNSILGWSKLLVTNTLDPETSEKALEIINRNAHSQAQLIDDILDVARLMRGKLRLLRQKVDLLELVNTTVESMRPLADAKGLQLISQVEAGHCTISGDPERLQQIFRNLLANAVKFTPEGGQVEVNLSLTTSQVLAETDQSLADHDLTNYAQITVKDTGIGIKAEFLPHIFEYFQQADSSSTRTYGGLGLGLAIVRQLVDLHGGKIYVASAGQNQGATFTIYLPIHVPTRSNYSLHQAAAQGEGNLPCLEGVSALVVDDNDDNRDFISMTLTRVGVRVMAAATAQEALDYLQQGPPDVLVSDIAMPETDGYDLIQDVQTIAKEKGWQIPAIAVTAYAKQEDQVNVLSAGFQAFLPKPIDPAELVNAIAHLVGDRVRQV